MRAWLLEEGDATPRLGEVPEPPLGARDVRVALRASALNHLDAWVARGMPRPPDYPHVPGADGAGVVVEAGEAVEDVRPGDEVVIDPSTSCGRCDACLAGDVPLCPDFAVVGEHRWGTHAEHVVVPAANAVAKPEGMDWERASAFGLVTSSAVRMLVRARLRPGETVLVIGVGGGSAMAAFLVARARGARLVAASTNEAARAWALANGAEAALDAAGAFDEQVRAHTGERGVDVVVDNVGTVTFERSLRSLARGGRLVTNGSTSGRTAELHLPTLFWRHLEVVGSSMNDRAEFAEAVDLVATGEVEVPVEQVFPFEAYREALAALEGGRRLGKLVCNR
jgi:NADPH:quinone reductase-like Zn-dependent oxidoreductase